MPAILQNLANAISTGELMVAIYHGGHAPGSKRRIQPKRITGDLVYALDGAGRRVKTFRLDKLELCDEDHPAPWAEETRRRQIGVKVDPETYFAGWAFKVTKCFHISDSRHFWPALGVTQRQYVDQEATEKAKLAAKERGESKQDIKRIKIYYLAWAVAPIPELDFHEGDLFYSTRADAPIQVVAVGDFLEVHRISSQQTPPRQAFHIADTELAEWLENGNTPWHAQIGPDLSYSNTLRYSIHDPYGKPAMPTP